MMQARSFRRARRRAAAPGALSVAWPALVLVLWTSACATPPRNPPPETNSSTLNVGFRDYDNHTAVDLRHQPGVGVMTVPASATAVWAVLPGVFEQLQIDVSLVEADEGIMGNDGYRARRIEGQRLSRWLDCGRGPVQANADEYQVTLTVIVQLLVARGGTTLRTTVDAYARERGVSSGPIHCLSWGNLERRIPQLVMERLGVEAP